MEYYTIKQIADMFHVDYQVIRLLILDGHLKAVKVGRQWRISQVDLDRYIKVHSTELQSRL